MIHNNSNMYTVQCFKNLYLDIYGENQGQFFIIEASVTQNIFS